MKNLVASTILVLCGLCAGVGLSLLPIQTVVHGAPGEPNPALKHVEHDATLTGDGTASDPLAVANGANTVPKLSAAVPPSEGQVLGFNGANLAWQNAAADSARVVDSLGQVVGHFDLTFGSGAVLRKIGDFTFYLFVEKNGFQRRGFTFYHTATDCSGPRYAYDSGAALFKPGSTTATHLFYAAEPLQQITFSSEETFSELDDPTQPGDCSQFAQPAKYPAGLVKTFDLSTLGLVPPFHLEF